MVKNKYFSNQRFMRGKTHFGLNILSTFGEKGLSIKDLTVHIRFLIFR